jgi:hypothetical protein
MASAAFAVGLSACTVHQISGTVRKMSDTDKSLPPEADNNVLAGYVDIEPFAKQVGRCMRTVIRWMDQADGLPFTRIGNRRLVHVATAREWIFSRMNTRNPRRMRKADQK